MEEQYFDIPSDGHLINMADYEQTRHESKCAQLWVVFKNFIVWSLFEIVVTLAQIVACIVVLTMSKDAQMSQELYVWLISYTCASIATLPFVCCRLCDRYTLCFYEGAKTCVEKTLDYCILGLVIIFLLEVLADPTTLNDTTQFFWFWVALLAFSCIRYVLPKFEHALLCVLLPLACIFQQIWDHIEKFFNIISGFFQCICCCD